MARIFISYATADRVRAKEVHDALENGGVDCWMAPDDIPPGENWPAAIFQAIQGSGAMVLIFSRNANDSGDVNQELLIARERQVTLIPFFIEDIRPTGASGYHLTNIQRIDAFRLSMDEARRSLRQALETRGFVEPVRPAAVNQPPVSSGDGFSEDTRAIAAVAEMPAGAVYLSFDSADIGHARSLAQSLKAAGLAAFLGSMPEDHGMSDFRTRFAQMAVFVPIISHATTARAVAYFRLEWRLAIERANYMAEDVPFIVPVVIDNVSRYDPAIPDEFRRLEWTKIDPANVDPQLLDTLKGIVRRYLVSRSKA